MLYTILYRKSRTDIGVFLCPPHEIKRGLIGDNYLAVKTLAADDLEDVYHKMQGEVWSPNGEASELIKELGLDHTSMSMGDIAYCHESHDYYYCSWIGWDKIKIVD